MYLCTLHPLVHTHTYMYILTYFVHMYIHSLDHMSSLTIFSNVIYLGYHYSTKEMEIQSMLTTYITSKLLLAGGFCNTRHWKTSLLTKYFCIILQPLQSLKAHTSISGRLRVAENTSCLVFSTCHTRIIPEASAEKNCCVWFSYDRLLILFLCLLTDSVS